MSEKKRLVGVRKLSLAGMADGWDDECYALYLPSSYVDQLEMSEMDPASMTRKQQIEVQLETVGKHFVGGRVKQLDLDTGELSTTDLTFEDVKDSIPMADALYAAIMGFDLDPKAIRQAVMENKLPIAEAKPGETSSSEMSPSAGQSETPAS